MSRIRKYKGSKEVSTGDLEVRLKSEVKKISKIISLKDYFTPKAKDSKSLSRFFKHREWSAVSKTSLKSRKKLKRVFSSSRNMNKYKGEVPGVGTYELSKEWIKPSFSIKSCHNYPFEGNIKPMSTTKYEAPQTSIPKIKRKILSLDKKRNFSIPDRKKGVWEEFKIFGTPESMKTVFSFKSEKRQLLEYQLNITRGLEKLREITIGDNINIEVVH